MADLLSLLCGPCSRQPRRFLSLAWYTSVLLVAALFVLGCLSANRIRRAENGASAFAIVWTALLCLLLSVGGTLVMRRYQTPIAVGFLLGAVLMMAQQCLVLFAIFSEMDERADKADQANAATAAFLFLLFAVYGLFGALLFTFRNKLLAEMPTSQSAAAGAGGGYEGEPSDPQLEASANALS